jgi:hypothetical protein
LNEFEEGIAKGVDIRHRSIDFLIIQARIEFQSHAQSAQMLDIPR